MGSQRVGHNRATSLLLSSIFSSALTKIVLSSLVFDRQVSISADRHCKMACKLNKQGDNIQPWHTPFPILNQSVVPT